MATISTFQTHAALDANRHDGFGLILSATLPLAVFVIANGVAQFVGVEPLFFSPLGMSGWIGAALYLMSLPLFGIARWMIAGRGDAGRTAGWWLVALMVATIVFPFVIGPLDSLLASIASMSMLALGLAAGIRTASVSRRAGLIMLPGLGWMGFSAFVGLAFVAGWTPPFGLTHNQSV